MFDQFRSSVLGSTLSRFMVWIVLGVIVALAIALFQSFWGGNGFRESPAASQRESSTLSSIPNRTDWSQTWVIGASEAKSLLNRPNTILLDARGLSRRVLTHIDGAIPVHWRSFSQSDTSRQGNLLGYADPNQRQVLEQKIRDLGISEQTVVLVYGEPIYGWGEEGRIVWMLKTLGHDSVALIDGGIKALIQSGAETSVLPSYTISEPGHFQIQVRSDWTVTSEDVRRILNSGEETLSDEATSENVPETPSHVTLVDTREAREYEGETPYGELRGGHIPGAVHLYFKELLSDNGLLKTPQEIQNILQTHNISLDSDIIAYCTGGIRSAWFVSVLNHLGYEAQNYAGSAWEWSSLPEDQYPLE